MLIEMIEVSMAADGTYTLHEIRETQVGRQVLRVVTGASSIPLGLVMLSNLIQDDARGEFGTIIATQA